MNPGVFEKNNVKTSIFSPGLIPLKRSDSWLHLGFGRQLERQELCLEKMQGSSKTDGDKLPNNHGYISQQ